MFYVFSRAWDIGKRARPIQGSYVTLGSAIWRASRVKKKGKSSVVVKLRSEVRCL